MTCRWSSRRTKILRCDAAQGPRHPASARDSCVGGLSASSLGIAWCSRGNLWVGEKSHLSEGSSRVVCGSMRCRPFTVKPGSWRAEKSRGDNIFVHVGGVPAGSDRGAYCRSRRRGDLLPGQRNSCWRGCYRLGPGGEGHGYNCERRRLAQLLRCEGCFEWATGTPLDDRYVAKSGIVQGVNNRG